MLISYHYNYYIIVTIIMRSKLWIKLILSILACFQVTSGVISIFGPQDPLLGIHVQSLCDALDIPHMEARLQNLGEAGHSKEFSINLHPGSAAMSDSLRDLIIYLNWTKVAVLYEDDMCKYWKCLNWSFSVILIHDRVQKGAIMLKIEQQFLKLFMVK